MFIFKGVVVEDDGEMVDLEFEFFEWILFLLVGRDLLDDVIERFFLVCVVLFMSVCVVLFLSLCGVVLGFEGNVDFFRVILGVFEIFVFWREDFWCIFFIYELDDVVVGIGGGFLGVCDIELVFFEDFDSVIILWFWFLFDGMLLWGMLNMFRYRKGN